MQQRADSFALTRWTLVERARGQSSEARAALRELCDAYYASVVAFLRRHTGEDEAARDLAHECFAKLLDGDSPGNADRAKGRFRSYLLGAVKHFLLNHHRDRSRQKRGGTVSLLSLNSTPIDCPDLDPADPHAAAPDASFDRDWAVAIISQSTLFLEAEWKDAGKSSEFDLLKPWLNPAAPPPPQAEAAARLGTTEGALKVSIYRLRKRFRERVRHTIVQTLDDRAELDSEMQHLIHALIAEGAR